MGSKPIEKILTKIICVVLLIVNSNAQFQSHIPNNENLPLPSMPGPPYPDTKGENRWGVKFDPRIHGPPFDRTRAVGQQQQQLITNNIYHGQQYRYPNQNRIQSPAPISNSNLVIALPYQQPQIQQQSQPEVQHIYPQNGIGWKIQNRPSTPNIAIPHFQPMPMHITQHSESQPLFHVGHQQQSQQPQPQLQPHASPTNINQAIHFQYPPKSKRGQKPRQKPIGLYIQHFANTVLGVKPRRPHKRPRQSFKVFTTLGRGLDAATGKFNTVRRVVKGTTGTALASGVKLGGKLAYVSAGVLSKVIKKASRI